MNGIWGIYLLSWLILLLLGYFLGCLNGSVMISHFVIRDDVRQHGSGNAGLTNFYRTYGARYALGVILFDMGKTVLGMYVIPSIILALGGKVVKCYSMDEMNRNADEVKRKRFVYLDDIGTESPYMEYGNKRAVFAEIMDNAEKNGNIVIASTNLNRQGLTELYGDRVIDRIRSTMRVIPFNGKSMRN